jgi:hypothetical protein
VYQSDTTSSQRTSPGFDRNRLKPPKCLRAKPTVQSEIRTEDNRPAPEPGPVVRDPLANLRFREGRPRTFEYNPEFKEEELL